MSTCHPPELDISCIFLIILRFSCNKSHVHNFVSFIIPWTFHIYYPSTNFISLHCINRTFHCPILTLLWTLQVAYIYESCRHSQPAHIVPVGDWLCKDGSTILLYSVRWVIWKLTLSSPYWCKRISVQYYNDSKYHVINNSFVKIRRCNIIFAAMLRWIIWRLNSFLMVAKQPNSMVERGNKRQIMNKWCTPCKRYLLIILTKICGWCQWLPLNHIYLAT